MRTALSRARLWRLGLRLGWKIAKPLVHTLLCAAPFLSLHAQAGTQIVTRLQPGQTVSGVGGGDAYDPILTPDGRFAVFASTSDNLVTGPGGLQMPEAVPAHTQVFARDRQTGVTSLVSFNLAGNAGGNGDSFPDAISANGQFVIFESDATNLVSGDTNGATDVFLRDIVHQTTTLISVGTNGAIGNDASSEATITPDGRYVAFVSLASNLTAGDTNGIPDIFVRDTVSGTTTLASPGATTSLTTSGFTAGGGSEMPALSADGRYVAFFSAATNLVSGVNSSGELYLLDLTTGTTAWVSAAAHASNTNENAVNFAMSTNGQFIAYQTTFGAPGGMVFRYHAATGVSDDIWTNGVAITSDDPEERAIDISADGRFVAFTETNASGGGAIELWDANSAAVALISGANTNSDSELPRVDATGRYVAFTSDDPTLTPNSDGNYHVYVRDTTAGTVQLADVNPTNTTPISSVSNPFYFCAGGSAVGFDCEDGALSMNAYKNDAFVRDLTSNRTEVLSVPLAPMASVTPLFPSGEGGFAVSSNGQFVVFTSAYDPTVASNTNSYDNVFVHDFATGSNTLVSVSADGSVSGSSESMQPSISPDGRWVAFASMATNLVANDTNGVYEVFLRDTESNTTTLVSADLSGAGEGTKDSTAPQVSAGGRYVLFWTASPNLTTNSIYYPAAFWRDMQAGVTCMIPTTNFAAMTPDGTKVLWEAVSSEKLMLFSATTHLSTAVGAISTPGALAVQGSISPDGTRALVLYRPFSPIASFGIIAADLIAGTNWPLATIPALPHSFAQFSPDSRFVAYPAAGSNKINQVYLYDFQTGSNLLATQAYSGGGGGNAASDSPTMGGNRYVAYRSAATNLAPDDFNGVPDIFVFDRLTGGTTLVSASQLGPFSAGGRSLSPAFSADGHTLVFESWASDLAPGDANEYSDIFAVTLGESGSGGTNGPGPEVSGITIQGSAASWLSGAPLNLAWPAVAGAGYQVQFKNDLSDPQWQTLTNPPTVVGSQGNILDSTPDPEHRFYRIVTH